jgi:hypothetical protein
MSWNNENRVHACLWAFETWYCMQRGHDFDLVGQWKTSYVMRLGGGSSGEFSTHSAQAHAEKLDEFFTDVFHANYINSSNSNKAVTGMSGILADINKTVAELGVEMVNHYEV